MASRTRASKNQDETVYFEAVLKSATDASLFDDDAIVAPASLISFTPPPGRGAQAAKALKSLGFTVRHVGTFSISGEGSRRLWERVFKTKVERRRQAMSDAHPRVGRREYFSHVADTGFQIPRKLAGLVERAYPQRPPTFYVSPLPPRVSYHHLRVPADVSMLLRSEHVHKEGVTGDSVLVAMVDTGFYKHPFYQWHGYSYNATLAPDATDLDEDANGHGTATSSGAACAIA